MGIGRNAFLGLLLLLAAMPGKSHAEDDPYLWLEERYGEPALAWVDEQNERTRSVLTSDPRFAQNLDAVLDLIASDDAIAYGAELGGHVYNFWQDADHPLGVWRRASPASYATDQPDWETLIDIDLLVASEGTQWVFVEADCRAPDYLRCLVSLSPDGGDAIAIREFDIGTRSFVNDGFSLPVSKSSVVWLDADTILVESAVAEGDRTRSGYPRVVRRLRRGQPIEEATVDFEIEQNDEWAWTSVMVDTDGTSDVVYIRNIDFYTMHMFFDRADGDRQRVPLPEVMERWDFLDGQLVFQPMTDWTSPSGRQLDAGGLYALDFRAWKKNPDAATFEVLWQPQARSSVLEFAASRHTLYVSLLDNVQGRAVALRRKGGQWAGPEPIDLPANGAVTINHVEQDGDSVSFSYQGFLTPPSLYWSDDSGRTIGPAKVQPARFVASAMRVEQFEAVSKDDTKVPYFVVAPAERHGPVPAILYGYGGFEVSLTPSYSGTRGRLWLERGNAWLLANIRGGGEFGPDWHRQALGPDRQKAFDDFVAIAEDAVARGITSPQQLGIFGGSNGGLLVGVTVTQRPELIGAAISEVPLLDMMRYTQLPPGSSWIAEYGDPDTEAGEWLRRWSPYQNVQEGRPYPPTLFMTSTADDRVHPGHARKMAARMQEVNAPALFHEVREGGHGGSGDLRRQAEWAALEYTFLQRHLEGEDALTADNGIMDRSGPGKIVSASTQIPCIDVDARRHVAMNRIHKSGLRARLLQARQLCVALEDRDP